MKISKPANLKSGMTLDELRALVAATENMPPQSTVSARGTMRGRVTELTIDDTEQSR